MATRDEPLRCLVVGRLPPNMDSVYLFNCFHDNAEVLAATVLTDPDTRVPLDYGYVEFATHNDAKLVMESYNGERMPNFNREKFYIIWDTLGHALRWRWIPEWQRCSYFGFLVDSEQGTIRTASMVMYEYAVSPSEMEKYRNPRGPLSYMETSVGKRLKLMDKPFVDDHHHRVPMEEASSVNEDKELYLCFEEVNIPQATSCYVIRTIKLSELLLCFCEREVTCEHCATKTKKDSLFRQRAWLYSGEKLPESNDDAKVPMLMSCCPLIGSSQIIFAGGVHPFFPKVGRREYSLKQFEPSQDVYSFKLNINYPTSWKKHDSRIPQGVPGSLLFKVNGVRYCFAVRPRRCEWGSLEHLSSEELTSNCYGWSFLPYPSKDLSITRDWLPALDQLNSFEYVSCAVVGSKILISADRPDSLSFPVMCIDVNDKDMKWREMPSFFYSRPLPFIGRALVVDLNNGTSDKVLFGYSGGFRIFVARVKVDDVTNDMSIVSYDTFVPFGFDEDFYENRSLAVGSSTFVDLGEGKVAFFLSNMIYFEEQRSPGKVRVVVVVLDYYLENSAGRIRSDVLATRIFEYNCHASAVRYVNLKCGFVVNSIHP